MVSKKTVEKVEKEEEQLQDYEMIFIISPTVSEENLTNAIETVSQFITGKGGEISDVEQWGKKKLAYPIKHHDEGTYVLARFKMKPAQNKELEVNLRIYEDVLRHLLIKID